MKKLSRVLLCGCALAAVGPSDCEPGPYEARNVAAQVQGCHQARITWARPQQTPTSLRLRQWRFGGSRKIVDLPATATSYTLRSWWTPGDEIHVQVESLDASGVGLDVSEMVTIRPPACEALPLLRTAVLLVNLNPPVGDPTPWTLNEAADFFFGAQNSVGEAIYLNSFGRQQLVGNVYGYFGIDGASHCVWDAADGQFNQCQTGTLFPAVLDAAESLVDFSQYDRVAMLFSGRYTGGTSYVAMNTDEGPVPVHDAPFAVRMHLHEMGHNSLAEDPFLHALSHAGAFLNVCSGGRPFPVDPTAPQECSGFSGSGDISPLTSDLIGGTSIHYTALHKALMGYLPAERIHNVDPRYQAQVFDLHDVTRPYVQDPARPVGYQLIRIQLDPFGYEYYLEYRNELQATGTQIDGVVVRLARPSASGNDLNSVGANRRLILNSSKRVFDDPTNNVRVEWLRTLAGRTAEISIGPSSGTPAF